MPRISVTNVYVGVRFTQEPLETGPVTTAVLEDTCGNLVQLASGSAQSPSTS